MLETFVSNVIIPNVPDGPVITSEVLHSLRNFQIYASYCRCFLEKISGSECNKYLVVEEDNDMFVYCCLSVAATSFADAGILSQLRRRHFCMTCMTSKSRARGMTIFVAQ